MAPSLRAFTHHLAAPATLRTIRHCAAALLALLLLRPEARATHAMGGELTYTYQGANQYLVTLNFYRDCNGVAAPTSCSNGLTFNVSSAACGANFSQCFTLQGVQIITPICATELDRCTSASGTYGVEKYTYTKLVNLSSWAGCGNDWVFSWSLCCRNNAITSLVNPGNQDLYLSTRLNNVVTPHNNSPVFTNPPTPYYCFGQPISYNPGAVDPDGDVLQFDLINARGAGGVNLAYVAGYSALQPIHNSGGANAVAINASTGTVTCVPDLQQVAVVTYRVREFRAGVQVGEVTRDVQFVVRPCPGNTSPVASGINGGGTYATSVCANQPISFTINGSDANAGQLVAMTWNSGIPGGTFTVGGTPTNPVGTFSWTPTTANIGNNVFTVTVTDNACPLVGTSNTGISITVTPPFTPINAGPDLSACGSVTLAATLPWPSVPHQWSVVSGSGTFSDATNPNAFVTGLAPGVNVFQWTVDYGTCGVSTDQVTVTNYSTSQASANAGPDQNLCGGTTATLAGNTVTAPAVGTWTLVSGTGTITSPNSPTSGVTGLGIGQNRFRWSVDNGPCSGVTFDDVFITVYNSALATANAGPDQSICTPTSSVTMNASAAPAPASGQWTVVSGSGGFTNSNSATTTVVGIPVGVHVYRWTVNNGPCGSSQDDVTVTVYDSSSPSANAGTDQQVCGTTATLTGSAPIFPSSGTWTVVSGGGTITNANSPFTTVTGMSIGTNVFQWTVNNGACASGVTSDQVTVVAYSSSNPAANAGPDQELCSNSSSTVMAGNAPIAPAVGTWSILLGSGTIVSPNSPTTAITGLAVGENRFRWSMNNGPCPGSPSFDDVSIFVYDQNQNAANAGADQQLCTPVTSANLAGNAATFPAVGTWTLVSGSGTITNANSPTSTVTGLGVGNNVFAWTIDNGPCSNPITTDQVTITVFNASNPVANAGPDQQLCTPTLSTTLAGSATIFPATGAWTTSSGATITAPGSPTTTVTGLSVGENIFTWTVSNGPCASGITADQVSIFVYDANNAIANAGPDQQLCTPNNNATMAASSVTFPATGTWTVTSGGGTITDPNDPTTTITAIPVGVNVFTWTVSNGPCANPLTTDQVTITVFDDHNELADAGPDQSICVPTFPNTVNMAASSIIFPAVGTWTLVSGSGTIVDANDPATAITNLAVGINTFQWTVSNGPCTDPLTTDQVTIFVYDAANPVADAGPDQSLCTPITSTTLAGSTLIAPATGQWSVVLGSGTFADPTDPNTTVSNLQLGPNVFMWSVSNGPCLPPTTTDLVTITLFSGNAQQADAGPDQELCNTSPFTVLAGNTPVSPATGSWSVISGGAVVLTPTQSNSAVASLSVGENILAWTIDNGACGVSVDQVSIFVYDELAPTAHAGPDQDLCTPNTITTLAGSAPTFPSTGTWTLVSGAGTIVDPASPTSQVTGLGVGVNVFEWTVDNGPCSAGITSDQVAINVFDSSLPDANAGADQQLCTPTTSTTLAGSSTTVPAVGTWSVVAGTGIFVDTNDPTTDVSGLTVGANTFQWSVSNGPCGASTDQVTIFLFDANNPVADAGPDQELCTPLTNATLNGSSLIFPATGTWTLVSGTGSITDPTDPNTPVTGLGIGPNVFEWTVSNGPCANPITADQITITVFDQNEPAANAGPDQEFCTPVSSTTLSANTPTLPATGSWSLISGTGTIVDPTDPNTQVNGLTVGEHIFQWTISNGPCPGSPSPDQVSIFIFDENNPIADAGADQQLCTPASSTTLAGSSVIFPASGAWTLVSGTGTIADPTDPNTAVTGLSVGENIFEWTVSNGPCANPITTDQVSIFLFDDANPVANAGPDQSLCTPTINATLGGSSVIFPATGTWTLIAGSGTIADPNDPATVISNMAVGENVLVWTVNNGPCTSGITTDTVSIFLYDENNPNADAGPDQAICTPASSVTLAGSAVIFPAVGTWTLVSGTGTISDPNDPNTTVTGLVIGETVLQWSVDNGPCANSGTSDQVSIFVFDENDPTADAGPDQQLCTPTASTTLAGSAVTFPATGTWTLVSGTGSIVSPNDPNTDVIDLTVGESVFAWTVDNGPCASGATSDTMVVQLFDALNPIADAGPDQNLCTPLDSAQMAGSNVIFPAVGTWTVVSGTGTITDIHDPNTMITALGVGVNVFEWTVDNGPCESGISSDQVTITLFDDSNPVADAGPDQELCTPTTSTALAGSPIIFPAEGTWTVVLGTGTFADASDPNTTVSDLSIGENIFLWTVTNGPCSTPFSEDMVSIFVFDGSQAVADAGPDQSLCTPVTSADMAGSAYVFPATGTWTLVSGAGTIVDPTDPNTTITDLGIGTNVFEWTVDNGPCTGVTTDQVTILLFDLNAPPADAGPDQEFCFPDTTTTLAGNPPTGAGTGLWTVSQGTATFADPTDPTTSVTGLSIGENILTWTLINGVCGTSTDDVSIFIFDPLSPPANAGPDVEICVPQDSIYLSGNTPIFPAIGTWSQISGAGLFEDVNDPTSKVVGLAIGENTFVWTLDNGPCANAITSDTMTVILYSDSTDAPDAGPDLEICLPLTQINLQATAPTPPADGTWTLVSGVGTIVDPTDSATLVTDLQVGISTFVWTLDLSPCANSGVLTDTMTVSVFDPAAPPADAGPDIELCTPTTNTVMAANTPLFPATGTWSLISGAGTIADTTDPATAISGLAIGENVFVWEIYNGDCGLGPNITYDTVSVIVYDATAPAADAGTDQQLCTPTTSTGLEGNAATFPAVGTWTLVGGTGTIADPNDPNTAVSGLTVGENVFVWSIDNGPCPNGTTTDSVSIFLFDENADPADAGPDQEICIPTMPSTVTMAANAAVFPGFGTWTLVSGTGTIVDPNDPSTLITGLAVGVNVFAWTIDNGPCPGAITTDEVQIIVFDAASPDADAGPDQELCTPESSAQLDGNSPIFPAGGFWTIVSGGGTITDNNDPDAVISGLGIGQTVLTWTIDNGPCANGLTTDTVVISVFDGTAAAAAAGPDQDFCSPVSDPVTMLANSPVFPAIGTWVLLSGTGTIANANDPFTAITGLGLGVNVFEWSIDNGDCGTSADQVSLTVYDSSVPDADAGESQYFCQDDFTQTNLDAVPATSTATGAWYQWVEDVWQPVGTDPGQLIENGLNGGNNIFQWVISNGPCPSTLDTMIVFLDDCLTIIVPNAFSPNSDGHNDTYVIENLESYPNNSLQVFNRWGSKVLDRSPYLNDWDGKSENSMNWGEELPESTYYFTLDLGDGSEVITGYIYLKR